LKEGLHALKLVVEGAHERDGFLAMLPISAMSLVSRHARLPQPITWSHHIVGGA
jgi:hypothetical protein